MEFPVLRPPPVDPDVSRDGLAAGEGGERRSQCDAAARRGSVSLLRLAEATLWRLTRSSVESLLMPDTPQNPKYQPGLDELISLSQAAALSGFTQPHLALLIRQGKLWGIKIGRNWVTTEIAVREYLSIGHKPGPKPGK